MAGDWIKMRCDLFTHPKVVRISSALKADTLRTIGGLMSAWCLFDAHSVDGKLEGYTSQTLDEHLRWPGFAAALVTVEWLVDDGKSLVLPRFDTHNGDSAKRRAQDADRKRAVRKTSAPEADKMRTREEKRREEKTIARAKIGKTSARGSRLPPKWEPPADLWTWAKAERPDIDHPRELECFRDYWAGQPGAKGVKLDWPATYRNWIRRARGGQHGTGTANGGSGSRLSVVERIAENIRAIEKRDAGKT